MDGQWRERKRFLLTKRCDLKLVAQIAQIAYVRLSGCPAVRLSGCPAVRLSGCPALAGARHRQHNNPTASMVTTGQ